MEGGIFSYEGDGDRLVEVFLRCCERIPGAPGLGSSPHEGGGDREFVEVKYVSEMAYKALSLQE